MCKFILNVINQMSKSLFNVSVYLGGDTLSNFRGKADQADFLKLSTKSKQI